jgi:hypothetical protein
LRPINFVGRIKTYAANDRKYMIAAVTKTTRRFGPSGSLKNTNRAREHTITVIAKISNEVFFDLKYMYVII